MGKKSRAKINGHFFPWRAEMGNSPAMSRLRKNSEAVNVLSIFITKYTLPNQGKDLCVTYSEARPYMSSSTFSKAKLWCMAFGFLHCTQFGRLERNASRYDLSEKWRHLSQYPEKLDHIERILEQHAQLLRTTARTIPEERWKAEGDWGTAPSPGVWKRQQLRKIEREILHQ